MPSKCERCSIGLGKSMYYLGGQWIRHKHLSEANEFRDSLGKMIVCYWCLEELEGTWDDEEDYL